MIKKTSISAQHTLSHIRSLHFARCRRRLTSCRLHSDVARRLVTELSRWPIPLRDPLPADLASLTERELDVTRLIAHGLTNAEIATRLFLGETTVKSHVTSILAKLGARDRVQVVVRCYEAGLIRPGRST